MVAILLYLESNYMLPSIPTRGHGMVLLAFVTAAFVVENLAFISWFSPLWWWTVRKYVMCYSYFLLFHFVVHYLYTVKVLRIYIQG
jgi:Mitochondrial ABC-transporter N-terminal five TM region